MNEIERIITAAAAGKPQNKADQRRVLSIMLWDDLRLLNHSCLGDDILQFNTVKWEAARRGLRYKNDNRYHKKITAANLLSKKERLTLKFPANRPI